MRKRRRSGDLEERGASVDASSEEGSVHGPLVLSLVEAEVASEPRLRQMAAEAEAQGIGLGELVVACGLLDEEGMARLVARQAGLPFLARGSLTIDPTAARLLAFEQAQTLRGCVTGIREDGVLVVVDDPSTERLDALRAQVATTSAGASVSFAVVTASSLSGLLGQLARLSGRRPDPDRSSPTRTPPPVAGSAGQVASRRASDDQLLADLQLAAATEQALQARLDRLQTERDAARQEGEQLQQQVGQLRHQLEAAEQQRAGERDADSELQARLDQLESEREAARQEGEQLQQQVEQLQHQLQVVDEQRVSERDHGSQLQARLDQLESERDAAVQQVEQLQQQLESVDRQRVSERLRGSRLRAPREAQRIHLDEDHEPRRHIRALAQLDGGPSFATSGEVAGEVPLINVRLLEGVFSRDERRQLAKGLITAVVGVKGESFRDQAEVLIAEVPVGNRYEREAALVPEEADTPR